MTRTQAPRGAETGMGAVKEANLQTRFEQLESSLNEAHSIVSQMLPREEDDMKPEEAHATTSTATAVECQRSVLGLINRLHDLKDKVGLV